MGDQPLIRIPVKCATCNATALVPFPVMVVVTALTVWNQMRLYTKCHSSSWSASAEDLRSIREHLGSAWIEEQRVRMKRARPDAVIKRSALQHSADAA